MDTIVLLLLGLAFAGLAWSGWRSRAAADPASSVEGFARVLAAIDPERREVIDLDEPVDVTEQADEQVPDLR